MDSKWILAIIAFAFIMWMFSHNGLSSLRSLPKMSDRISFTYH